MRSTLRRPVEERTRRRFARRQWARRWLAWRYVVAVVLLVGLVGGGIWAVYGSSLLAVEGVEVTGTQTLDDDHVRAVAAVPTGEPLASVDLAGIQRRVEALAVVKSADVSREWPHKIRIEIEERVAIAVVEIGGQLRGMDASGVVFRDYHRAPPGLPRIVTSTAISPDALREAARVVSALPEEVSTIVDHVEVQTVDEISLVLRDGRTVRWGSADQSAEKAEVLAALLKSNPDASAYDVSVPGNPAFTPS
jgi:cell division protein FtsQ